MAGKVASLSPHPCLMFTKFTMFTEGWEMTQPRGFLNVNFGVNFGATFTVKFTAMFTPKNPVFSRPGEPVNVVNFRKAVWRSVPCSRTLRPRRRPLLVGSRERPARSVHRGAPTWGAQLAK